MNKYAFSILISLPLYAVAPPPPWICTEYKSPIAETQYSQTVQDGMQQVKTSVEALRKELINYNAALKEQAKIVEKVLATKMAEYLQRERKIHALTQLRDLSCRNNDLKILQLESEIMKAEAMLAYLQDEFKKSISEELKAIKKNLTKR